MHAPRRFRQFLAVSAFLLSYAAQAATSSPTGASVFQRRQLNPDATLRSSSLWLASSSGVRALTPSVVGTFDGEASWSPHGTWLAFQRGTRGHDGLVRANVFVMDRRGDHVHQLTHGPGSFEAPAWGPDTRIAYVSKLSQNDCLSVVDPDGHHQRDLFCAPGTTRLAHAQWSANGRALFVSGGYYEGRLSPVWHALAWRVDASTGAATRLTEKVMDEERDLVIAPDGRHGILTDVVPNEMTLVDFATQETTSAGTGFAPRWSRDGRRIAFTGEVYDFDPGLLYYNPLYVMDADGGNLRRVTRARVDNLAYIVADWSDDGTHLLANLRTYDDPALTLPRYALRWIDVDARTLLPLPAGYAETGAWFSH